MKSAGTLRHPVKRSAPIPPVMQCSGVSVILPLPLHGLQFPWCQFPVHGQHQCQWLSSDKDFDKVLIKVECLKAGKVGDLGEFLQKGRKLFLSASHDRYTAGEQISDSRSVFWSSKSD